MSFRFASLGSGSSGNATLVAFNEYFILIDCGFSRLEIEKRISKLNVHPGQLKAIMVTHEHGDHAGGVYSLASKYSIRVIGTSGTLCGANLADRQLEVTEIRNYAPFRIEGFAIYPFPVPHDASEPSQFVIEAGDKKFGILTDCGSKTPHVVEMLSGCDALLVEFNHDLVMLNQSRYPVSLKNRVASNYGHLDNGAAIDILRSIDRSRLKYVMAGHLSKENNNPTLVREIIENTLNLTSDSVALASQDDVSSWVEI